MVASSDGKGELGVGRLILSKADVFLYIYIYIYIFISSYNHINHQNASLKRMCFIKTYLQQLMYTGSSSPVDNKKYV